MTHSHRENRDRLTNGANVKLTGRLGESPGAGQEKELLVENVEILGGCDPEVGDTLCTVQRIARNSVFRHTPFRSKRSLMNFSETMFIFAHEHLQLRQCYDYDTRYKTDYLRILRCVSYSLLVQSNS